MTTRLSILPKGDKGRVFSAELLAHAEADSLWENGGTGDGHRPIWMVIAATEQEMRSFLANFLAGRPAVMGNSHRKSASDKIEVLRSSGFAYHSRRLGGGMVTTIYLPDLFRLDPGMVDTAGVKFVVLPPKAWVVAQKFDITQARERLLSLANLDLATIAQNEALSGILDDDQLHVLLAEGSLLLAYLDRRCRYPIPFDPIFGAWLLITSQVHRLMSRPDGRYGSRRDMYRIEGAENVNVLPGFAFGASHEALGQLLSTEVRRWHNIGSEQDDTAVETLGVSHG